MGSSSILRFSVLAIALAPVACSDEAGGGGGSGGSSGTGQEADGVCYFEYRASYSCSDGDGDPGVWEATCSDISEDACYNSPDFDGTTDSVDGCLFVTEFRGNEFLSEAACEERLPDPDTSSSASGSGGGGGGSGCPSDFPIDCFDGTCCPSAYPVCCSDGQCYADAQGCNGGGGEGICTSGLTTGDPATDGCLGASCCADFLSCSSNGTNVDACIACFNAGAGPLCDAAIACGTNAGCFGQ